MNKVTLIGHLPGPPTYFCTEAGQDLTRFQIQMPPSEEGDAPPVNHHCQAWGPAALDLHKHLNAGDRIMIQGELRYRQRDLGKGGVVGVPVIRVKGYSYLGRGI
jgi:single-stranded DNA-binding protein